MGGGSNDYAGKEKEQRHMKASNKIPHCICFHFQRMNSKMPYYHRKYCKTFQPIYIRYSLCHI